MFFAKGELNFVTESKENNGNYFNFFIESEVCQEQILFSTECLLRGFVL